MSPDSASLLLTLGAPALYLLTVWLVGGITGWRSLARRHPMPAAPGPRLGRLWRGSLQIGSVGRYHLSVVWSAHAAGLRLSAWFHLRPGHPPVFFPWTALQYVPRNRLWLLEGLDLVTPDGDRLWLPLAQARRLRAVSNGRFWPVTPPRTTETAPPAAQERLAPLPTA